MDGLRFSWSLFRRQVWSQMRSSSMFPLEVPKTYPKFFFVGDEWRRSGRSPPQKIYSG
jgi:hypothetical protein